MLRKSSILLVTVLMIIAGISCGKSSTDGGLFPAATVDNLSTGMELFDGSPWEYSKDLHIAPTAWFIMAANGFNPYAFD